MLGDPLTLKLQGAQCVPFAGLLPCPAIIATHLRAQRLSSPSCTQLAFVPIKTDFPYFDFLVYEETATTTKILYVFISSKELWGRLNQKGTNPSISNNGATNKASLDPFMTCKINELAMDCPPLMTPSGQPAVGNQKSILTPNNLLDAWQDAIQETLVHLDTDGYSLENSVKSYEDVFLQQANAGQSPIKSNKSGPQMTVYRNKSSLFNELKSKKKRLNIVTRMFFLEDHMALARAFGYGSVSK